MSMRSCTTVLENAFEQYYTHHHGKIVCRIDNHMLALFDHLEFYTTAMMVICQEGRVSFEADPASIMIMLYKMEDITRAVKTPEG